MIGSITFKNLDKFRQTTQAVSEVILDKNHEINLVLCCLLAKGHLLIEDHPGVGKTTLVQALAKSLGLQSSRIQFTNDLLPSDILGNSIFDNKNQEFRLHKGPLFSNFVLGDELNRASPRTQSALLQALEENQVTIDGKSLQLPDPFLFIATQNPKQQIGTYPLPESQLDRFLMGLRLHFSTPEIEVKLIQGRDPRVLLKEMTPILNLQEILDSQREVESITMSEKIAKYISLYLEWSRRPQFKGSPLSVRAGMALGRASRAWAWLNERSFILPEDVKTLAPYVLGHRLFPEDGVEEGQKTVLSMTYEVAV